MNIASPAMPYDFSDLEPAMSRDTVVFHFLRHQRVCYDRMLTLVRGTGLEHLPLEDLIRSTGHSPGHRALHRYAAEVWNHNVFWRSMRHRVSHAPTSAQRARSILIATPPHRRNGLADIRQPPRHPLLAIW